MSELKSILHVDDDEDILVIARMSLQLVDTFDLHQFSSGPAALAALDTVMPQLLLLDVMMPGMTGPELAQKIKMMEQHRDIPIIFMTAKAEDALSRELIADGALAVITKPFDPMTLGEQIRSAWRSRTAATKR